jgi:hypothetical protein
MSLFAVYGPAQHQHKQNFLAEMAHTCSKEPLPYIIGGDLNIMRRPEDKNKENFDPKWPILFNMVIQPLDLREIEISGGHYTWASSGDDPTFEKLDRVLVQSGRVIFLSQRYKAKDRSNSDQTQQTKELKHLRCFCPIVQMQKHLSLCFQWLLG